MKIVLASASPRRKELFQKLFEEFEIIPAQGEEICTKKLPDEIVQELAVQKAEEAEQILSAQEYLIVGADTVVVWNHNILGKPSGTEEAEAMLRMLAGNVHQVYTGVALIDQKNGRRTCRSFAECTNVKFYPMSAEEISRYVKTKEPLDKAGSYGIQGIGGRFVERVEGDYNNVVGLPVARIYQMLKQDTDIKLR